MPRASKKKDELVPKKSVATNKKRKRAEEDGEKSSNKRLKMGWFRDIKAVLRSASSRLVNIDNETKLNKTSKKKNLKHKNDLSEMCIITQDGLKEDEVGSILNGSSDIMDTAEKDSPLKLMVNGEVDNNMCTDNNCQNEGFTDVAPRKLEVENHSIKEAIQPDLEIPCVFQQIECAASGPFIRLENIPSSEQHKLSTSAESDYKSKFNQKDSLRKNISFDCQSSSNADTVAEELTDMFESDVERKKEHELKQDAKRETYYGFSQPLINATEVKDWDEKCSNSFNNHDFFFGIDNKAVNIHSDTGFTFASGQSDQRISSVSHNILDSNQVDMDVNVIEIGDGESISNYDLESDNPSFWTNRTQCNISDQNGNFLNGSTEHRVPFIDNKSMNLDKSDSESNSQQFPKLPMTEAYYDTSSGAYVDPLTLQDNKTQTSTNSFKNTWGSIKNLLSRVSGQKGGGDGDVQEDQTEETISQTGDELNS